MCQYIDGDLIGFGSNDVLDGLRRDKEVKEAFYKNILPLKSNHEEPSSKWIQILQIVEEPIVGELTFLSWHCI
jgi:hypothetical protein